jgi:ferredoxin-NADP reductase
MTSITLLQWILGVLLLQVVTLMTLAFVRHWQAYTALRTAAINGAVALPSPADDGPADADVPAWAGFRPFRVRAKTLEDAAGQVCSFLLAPEDGEPLAPFLPGQFLTFQLDLPSAQGGTAPVVRCYSLSDAPQSEAYRVTIKRAPLRAGAATSAHVSHYFHDQVSVGSLLQVRAPNGHFYLDRGQGPVVLIAGGIGITPMLSMVNWAMQEQPEREVWLFYGVREAAEGVMLPQLQALAAKHPNFHLHLCFSGPPPTADPREPRERATLMHHHHHSRIDLRLLRSVLPLKPYHFYLCGPTQLLTSLVPALEGWGVPDERIHFEAFGPASSPRKKAGLTPTSPATGSPVIGPLAVTFATSGKTCEWRPGMGSLLDFAEANGIEVASGCRSGSCGSCQTTIRAGQVRYARAPDHTPEPGSCLMCMSTPGTALTLDA